MTSSILTSGILILSSLLNVPVENPDHILLNDEKDKVDWSCGKTEFVKKTPKWKGVNFYGSLAVKCRFVGKSGGGYLELQPYLIKKLETESKKVHKGPVKEKFEKMDGVMMDVTMLIGDKKNNSVEVRQIARMATDFKKILISDSKSKSIKGTGLGKYLKKIDNRFVVIPNTGKKAKENEYNITVNVDFQLKKPFLIPRKVFEAQVRKSIKDQAKKIQKTIILDVAEHI